MARRASLRDDAAIQGLGHHDAERAAQGGPRRRASRLSGLARGRARRRDPLGQFRDPCLARRGLPARPRLAEPDLLRPGLEDHRPTPPTATTEGPVDPGTRSRRCFGDGRSQEAITLVSRAVREARTGRERFLRTFQQAEVCLTLGRPGVATTLLEGLARQIDELRLDHWEDTTLCARVVAALYRCLKGKDDARARSVYERLCQLDIGQAMSLGDVGDA